MASLDVFLNDVLAASQALWGRESKASAAVGETAAGLRAYAARVLGNATYADDIVQESYLRLVRSPPATDDPQQLRALLFRIASRLIIDHWRRASRIDVACACRRRRSSRDCGGARSSNGKRSGSCCTGPAAN